MNYRLFFRFSVFTLFSLWFGGFLFYSAFVISNAYAVLGDHETVGMITQRVTGNLNFIGIATGILLIINFFNSKTLKKAGLTLCGILVLSLIAQFILHSEMSYYIDLDKLELSNHKKFYKLHRIYLIVSTAQFFTLLAIIPLLIKGWQLPQTFSEKPK